LHFPSCSAGKKGVLETAPHPPQPSKPPKMIPKGNTKKHRKSQEKQKELLSQVSSKSNII